MDEKQCTKCKTVKPIGGFYRYRSDRRQYSSWCKLCEKDAAAARRDRLVEEGKRKAPKFRHYPPETPQATKSHNSKMRQRYGLNPGEKEAMVLKQKNLCAICLDTMVVAHVDHNHETGTVRELLCRRCNTVLGLTKEDPQINLQMVEYIKKHAS